MLEQSQSDRESQLQQLQCANESLVREKSELAEKLGALEAQGSSQAAARASMEKELEEVRGKLNETASQGVHCAVRGLRVLMHEYVEHHSVL